MASRLAAVQVEQPRPSRSYATNSTAAKSNRRTNNAPYRIERVRNAAGYEQEVLTLEDTPEPDSASSSRGAVAQPNPTASSSSYTNGNAYASTSGARYDPYGGYEPVTKKRKSDVGAGANGYSAYASGSNGYPQPGTYAAPAASSSGLKRKYDGNERENRDVSHRLCRWSLRSLQTDESRRLAGYETESQGQGRGTSACTAVQRPGRPLHRAGRRDRDRYLEANVV